MGQGTLLDKVWDAHSVRELDGGQTQLFIGLHLIHEVTSPQAFAMLREMGLGVRFPERTFATVDHIIPSASPRIFSTRRRNARRRFRSTRLGESGRLVEDSAQRDPVVYNA